MPKGVYDRSHFPRVSKEATRERKRITRQKERVRNREQEILRRARYRAKKLGLEFNLDVSDIVIPELCPLLEIPIVFVNSIAPGNPSLDRIDNTKGYVKGNVKVISYQANTMKSNATLTELLLFSKNIQVYTGEQRG
jgi:hypothetical protein